MTKTELQQLREDAHNAVAQALTAEAMASQFDGTGVYAPGASATAVTAAYVAIDKIDDLWRYAEELEAQIAYDRS